MTRDHPIEALREGTGYGNRCGRGAADERFWLLLEERIIVNPDESALEQLRRLVADAEARAEAEERARREAEMERRMFREAEMWLEAEKD